MTETATATEAQSASAAQSTPATQPIGPESDVPSKSTFVTRSKDVIPVHELKVRGLYGIIGALKDADLSGAPPMLSVANLQKLDKMDGEFVNDWWSTWSRTVVTWLGSAPKLLNAVVKAFADIDDEQIEDLGISDLIGLITEGIKISDPAGLVEVSRGFFQHIGDLLPEDKPEGTTDIGDVLAAAATSPAGGTTTGANGSSQ